jgi:hypothetical protein
MGKSGTSNFDSDAASDYVGDLVERLVKEIEQALAKPHSIAPDEYYGEVLPCIVEIIAALHQLSGTASIPPPETVAGWKSRFLAARTSAFGVVLDDTELRTSAIRNAFDRLHEMSRIVHEEM